MICRSLSKMPKLHCYNTWPKLLNINHYHIQGHLKQILERRKVSFKLTQRILLLERKLLSISWEHSRYKRNDLSKTWAPWIRTEERHHTQWTPKAEDIERLPFAPFPKEKITMLCLFTPESRPVNLTADPSGAAERLAEQLGKKKTVKTGVNIQENISFCFCRRISCCS